MLGYKSSSFGASKPKRQEKTAAQTASEGAESLGRFGSAMKDKKSGKDAVGKIQDYAKAEAERNKKKKQSETKSTAPQKGFVDRMIDKYWHKKKE